MCVLCDLTGLLIGLYYINLLSSRSCVRIVASERAGMGKSLYIFRRAEELGSTMSHNRLRSATLHGPELSRDNAVKVLINASSRDTDIFPYIYHLEVSDRVSSAAHLNCTVHCIER